TPKSDTRITRSRLLDEALAGRTRLPAHAGRFTPAGSQWPAHAGRSDALAGHRVERVVVARARLDVDRLAHARRVAAVGAHHEPLGTAVQRGVAVDVRVGAQLLDQLDLDRHAPLGLADQ